MSVFQAPSFYWELEIVSYGDSEDDSGPIVSFGFTTEAEKRDGAWTNPVGTCLFHKYIFLNSFFFVFQNRWLVLVYSHLQIQIISLPDPQ